MYARKGKLGVSWYSDFWYDGKRYKKAWGIIAKTIAKEKEIKFKHEIASGKYEGVKKKILFDKFVEQYLDYSKVNKRPESYRRDITSTRALLSYFKGKCLADIHPFLIEKYKKKRLEKVKPATVNRELACLKNMFNKAKKWNCAKENPVKDVEFFKEEPLDVTILTPKKEIEFLAELKSKKTKAVVITALNAGMRKKEIFDLMKDNVDFNKRVIHVTHTKNWEIRDIPMNELLTKTLKEVIEKDSSDSPYVFTSNRTGEAFKDIKNGFNKAVKAVGLERFRFHDLRHTWCSRLCELGVDESTIMKLGGWKTRSMIDRYSHPSKLHMRKAVEKLGELPLKITLDEKHVALIRFDNNANKR